MEQRRWAYKVIEIKTGFLMSKKPQEIAAEADRLGSQGWELVAVQQAAVGQPTTMYFKRPL